MNGADCKNETMESIRKMAKKGLARVITQITTASPPLPQKLFRKRILFLSGHIPIKEI